MGTRERRMREKGRRRMQILNAARRLFRQRGYEGTTMPAIAQAAELAPGTLYLYFPSKPALYVELLNEGYEMLITRLKEAAADEAVPRRQAEALTDAFMNFALEHPDYFDIIFFVLQGERRMVHELPARGGLMESLRAHESACKEIAAGILKRARPKDSSTERARKVEAVWSMLAGVVLYFVRDDPDVFKSVADEAREIILRAVFPER